MSSSGTCANSETIGISPFGFVAGSEVTGRSVTSPSKPPCRQAAPRDSCHGAKGAEGQLRGHKLGDTVMMDEVLSL